VNCIVSIRRAALPVALGVSLFVGDGVAFAQPVGLQPAQPPAILPATPPTAAQQPVPANVPPVAPVPAKPVVHRAQVVYEGGKLSIAADNSSLLQILRDVARQTGMKITGGVSDEQVFGKYGPDSPSEILASLLQGTGCNMLLRESATRAPVELVLTPRTGEATPPPISLDTNDDPPVSVEQPPAAPIQQSQTPSTPQQTPQTPPVAGFFGAQPTTTTATGTSAAPNATPNPNSNPTPSQTAQPNAATNPISPNGIKTPQQIFQQLQQLQQLPASSK
jgi:hypothetical protein